MTDQLTQAAPDAAYANDWQRFVFWCDAHACSPIGASPERIASFLETESALGYSASTLSHRLAAIGHMHRRRRLPPPLMREGGDTIRAALSRAALSRAAPRRGPGLHRATTTVLRRMLQVIRGEDLEAVRDRALIALRIAGAFQLSEIAALSLDHAEFTAEGLRIQPDARRSRATVLIIDDAHLQPLALLRRWVAEAGLTTGPLFREVAAGVAGAALTKSGVEAILQRRGRDAGFGGDALARIRARKSSVFGGEASLSA